MDRPILTADDVDSILGEYGSFAPNEFLEKFNIDRGVIEMCWENGLNSLLDRPDLETGIKDAIANTFVVGWLCGSQVGRTQINER